MKRTLRIAGLMALGLALHLASCADNVTAVSVPPEIGEVAPDFTQNDTAGAPVTLSHYHGKVVMIDFWATWCGPCLLALPNVQALWQRYRSRDFVLISVSLDYNLGTWRRFIHDNNLDWLHTADGNFWQNAVATRYGVDAIPAVFLIDKAGRIREKRSIVDARFQAAIESALAE